MTFEREYAHYRTAENAGTGFKPPYSGIPLTNSEHALQHRIGQYSFMPKEWWEKQTKQHLQLWVESRTK